ncbi:hypothetical protein [Marinobacter salsuginis]|jgi:hypothetical protein|uniref:Uncharacterized protein n=1 Tax=Marinobacter salsuginis TaxID=418719 RepID=A0A5M3Q0J3_9GAMM|nr:hypothetical protein [Marinobacter salsuginis]GBO88703.1 hypothetical protein MSSD14B_23710 [Marinobacter salsuginis]
MSDSVEKKRKKRGPVWRFLAVTLGPKAFVSKSFGSDVGSTVTEQYRELKKVNDIDIREAIAQRKAFDFERRCRVNNKSEQDVVGAYKNVAITQGFIWIALSVTVALAVAGMGSLITVAFNSLALIALPIMLLAATHHQICIKEKVFLSPLELLKHLVAKPGTLIPGPLPSDWKLYTSAEVLKGEEKVINRRKIQIRKKGG